MRGPPKAAIAGGMFVMAAAMPIPLWAQIKTDGTVGPARSLAGPNFTIGADLGRQVGGNLFHSFSTFNVKTGESATFTGPSSVANIIGRVTGGATSSVDGKIASTIAGANLFLINPSGWVFGPHASLDVQGSLHVSSADYLRHSDGARFQATTPNGSTFTSAPPEAFGFLGPTTGKISVNGSSLVTSAGKNLSMVGGPVQIIGGRVAAPAGQVHVASVAGSGEIGVNPADATKLTAQTFGSVDITSGATVEASDQATQQGGGAVYIRGGAITVDNSTVQSQNFGSTSGNPVSVQAGSLSLSNGGAVQTTTSGAGAGGPVQVDAAQTTMTSSGEIATRSLGPGTAGSITTSAGHITIDGTNDAPGSPAGIVSRAQSAGDSGAVSVSASNISIASSGQISSVTGAGGKAGDVTVTGTGPASTISIDGHGIAPTGIGSVANPGSTGAAGAVSVTAGSMSLLDGGQISAETFGAGKAGNVQVTATGPASSLTIEGDGTTAVTGILSQAAAGSTGDGGDIAINAGAISLAGTGQISSSTFSSGGAGRTTIAADSIAIDGSHTNSDGASTGIFSNSNVAGDGGNAGPVVIRANTVDLGVNAGISSSTFGDGAAGNVTVTGPSGTRSGLQLTIDDAHSPNGATSGIFSQGATGAGGTVTVLADTINLLNDGDISTGTRGSGNAGTVSVTAGQINASAAPKDVLASGIFSNAEIGSTGNAGDIIVNADGITLTEQGVISSSTFASGHAGTVSVDAGQITARGSAADLRPTGIFSLTLPPSNGGNAGQVVVRSNSITLGANGQISSSSYGNGAAGSVTVTGPSGTSAGLAIALDGENALGAETGILSDAHAAGSAGSVSVLADDVNLTNLAQISSSTFGSGDAGNVSVTAGRVTAATGSPFTTGIFTAAGVDSTGKGGDVALQVGDLTLNGRGSVVLASNGGPGPAGNISVDADRVMLNGGEISTSALQGDGGNISVKAGSLLYVNRGLVATDVALGLGRGGNITIDPPLIVMNDGTITANGNGGPGGNIAALNPFLETPNSQVTATSQKSTAGVITITTPVTGLASNLAPLSEKTVAVHAISHTACDAALRAEKAPSTIVLGGRGGLPEDAEGPQNETYFAGMGGRARSNGPVMTRGLSDRSGGGIASGCAAR